MSYRQFNVDCKSGVTFYKTPMHRIVVLLGQVLDFGKT